MENIGSMHDLQNLLKNTIAEFMENHLEEELDGKLGYSKYDHNNKDTTTASIPKAAKRCAPALEM